jgi:hypothetical protein
MFCKLFDEGTDRGRCLVCEIGDYHPDEDEIDCDHLEDDGE